MFEGFFLAIINKLAILPYSTNTTSSMKTTMKSLKVIIFITGFLLFIKPADLLLGQQYLQRPVESGYSSVYLGLGLSVNDYGLGIGMEVPLTGKISINGNLGLGGWGLKAGGSLNFYTKQISNKSEFSIGYSYASGLKDFNYELWVEPNETQKMINLDLNAVSTINFVYTYNLKIGSFCKAGFSAGYAVPITATPYKVKTQGVILSSTSEQIMDIMAPGGLIVGIRFMFGIN
jgi:hypothetical protein